LATGCTETKDPLRVVPNSEGFHFYTDIGHPCGISCTSLGEFANALQYLCSEAIIFHFARGDFQKWIREVIGDEELARRLDEVRLCSRQLEADCCRKELVETTRIRILQLEVDRGPPCFGAETK
jgi:hypothetical protein